MEVPQTRSETHDLKHTEKKVAISDKKMLN